MIPGFPKESSVRGAVAKLGGGVTNWFAPGFIGQRPWKWYFYLSIKQAA